MARMLQHGLIIKAVAVSLAVIVIAVVISVSPVSAQTVDTAQYQYYQGTVLDILDTEDTIEPLTGQMLTYQVVQVKIDDTNELVVVHYGKNVALTPEQFVERNDAVVVLQTDLGDTVRYDIIDHYRLPYMGWLIGLFFVIVVALTRWKGFGAIVSLALTGIILVAWLVPSIVNGTSVWLALTVSILIIALTSFYLGHGFTANTTIALVSTLVVIGLATAGSWFMTALTRLSGTGSEAALNLKFGLLTSLNLHELLLAGLLIGALGVLDDSTTAQATAVRELHNINRNLDWLSLFKRGFTIGREHIIALVNTLILAYAGASLPLFVAFTVSNYQPWWVTLNSETIMEQVMQSFVGSLALLLAVPLTTLLAALWYGRKKPLLNR